MRLILPLVIAFIISLPGQSLAGKVTFLVVSNHDYTTQIKFFSQKRKYSWPGAGQAYNITTRGPQRFSLNCSTGEKICWGAWDRANPEGAMWGVGTGRRSCSACCSICNGETAKATMNNGGALVRKYVAKANRNNANAAILGEFMRGVASGLATSRGTNNRTSTSGGSAPPPRKNNGTGGGGYVCEQPGSAPGTCADATR